MMVMGWVVDDCRSRCRLRSVERMADKIHDSKFQACCPLFMLDKWGKMVIWLCNGLRVEVNKEKIKGV